MAEISETSSLRADDLLTDLAFVVSADPERVLALSDRVSDPRARLVAAVYRASAGAHRSAGAAQRRQMLAVDAARFGDRDLAAGFAATEVAGAPPMGWAVDWASGSLVDHQLLRSLTGHTGPVRAVATTVVDGEPVAVTASRDHTARVWDLATGREIHKHPISHNDPISSMTADVLSIAPVVANGRPVALLNTDQAVLALDLVTGRELGEFIRSVMVGVRDGRSVALTIDAYQTLRVFDLMTGRRLDESVDAEIALVGGRPVALVESDSHTERRAWNLITGDEIHGSLSDEPEAAEQFVSSAAIVDGRLFAFSLDTGEVVPVSASATGRHVGESIPALETALLGGRPVALSIDEDESLHIWEPHAEAGIGDRGGMHHDTSRPRLPEISVTAVVEGRPATLAVDGNLSPGIWDLLTTNGHTGEPDGARHHMSPAGDQKVTAAALVEGQPLVITVQAHRRVLVVDLTTGRQVGEPLTGHVDQVWDVAAAVIDGRPVAVTGGADQVVRVWGLAAELPVGRPREGHTDTVLASATTVLDGRAVAVTAGADRTVRAWDLATGRPVGEPVTGLPGEVSAMAATTMNGRAVAVTSGADPAMHVWDLADGQRMSEIRTDRTGRVLAIATAVVDGRPVAVAVGTERAGEVWDLATGRRVGEPLTGHTGRILDIATTVVDDRPVAVTASWDKTIRVWDLGTGRQIGDPLSGHGDWVTSVVTTTLNGRSVAVTGSRDKTVRVWDLASRRQIGEPVPVRSSSARVVDTMVVAGRPVLLAGQDEVVRIWDLAGGRQLGAELVFPLPVGTLATASGGTLVVGFGREIAVLRAPNAS